MADQRKNFLTELKTFLTPEQIAKTMVLRKNFHKELRKQMGKQRKRDKLDKAPEVPNDKEIPRNKEIPRKENN